MTGILHSEGSRFDEKGAANCIAIGYEMITMDPLKYGTHLDTQQGPATGQQRDRRLSMVFKSNVGADRGSGLGLALWLCRQLAHFFLFCFECKTVGRITT